MSSVLCWTFNELRSSLSHHRIVLKEHRETPDMICFLPIKYMSALRIISLKPIQGSIQSIKTHYSWVQSNLFHGWSPNNPLFAGSSTTFFSCLKSQKLLFNTEIQHFGWLNQSIHFPLKPTERSQGLVLPCRSSHGIQRGANGQRLCSARRVIAPAKTGMNQWIWL